jgi:hypothetical protein
MDKVAVQRKPAARAAAPKQGFIESVFGLFKVTEFVLFLVVVAGHHRGIINPRSLGLEI